MTDRYGARIPVFIASVFRDMDHERDVINSLVIPNVNRRLRDDGLPVTLYPLDFRWGINTDTTSDSQLREQYILQRCIDELKRCAPFFVGLLGDRYGYAPDQRAAGALLTEQGVRPPDFTLSVTAIELLTAIREWDRASFPHPPIVLSRKSRTETVIGIDDNARHVSRLRTEVLARGYPIADYTPYDDDPQGFNRTFVDRLQNELYLRARAATDTQSRSWIAREVSLHLAAMHQHAEGFTGRTEELETIENHRSLATGIGGGASRVGDETNELWRLRAQMNPSMLALVGDEGHGKTALLAKVAREAKLQTAVSEILDSDVEWSRAYCQVGISAQSARLAVCLLVLLAQLDSVVAERIAADFGPEDLRVEDVLGAWLNLLGTERPGSETPIIMDGYDKLVLADPDSFGLQWMDPNAVKGAYFVISTTSDRFVTDLLRSRPSTTLMHLGPLSVDDANTLVSSLVAGHHRSLPADIRAMLVAKSTSPQWLSVAVRMLLTLSRHDYAFLAHITDVADPEDQVHELLRLTVRSMPTDLVKLFYEHIMGLAELADSETTVIPLALIAVADNGVRETDILAMYGQGAPYRRDPNLARVVPVVTPTELATVRDLFAAVIETKADRWMFTSRAAQSAFYDFLIDLAAEAGSSIDAIVLGYQRGLTSHLLSLPIDDSLRHDSLLPLLCTIAEFRTLVRVLHDPELSGDDAPAVFSAMVSADLLAPSELLTLIELNIPDDEWLTLAAALILSINAINAINDDGLQKLGKIIDRRLESIPPGTTSRSGATPADIQRILLESLAGTRETGTETAQFTDFLAALNSGDAGLADVPTFLPVSDVGRAILADRWFITIAVYHAASLLNKTRHAPDNRGLQTMFDEACEMLDASDINDPITGELWSISRSAAARTLSLVGLDGRGFVLDDDLNRAERVCDKLTATASPATTMGRCARVRALAAMGSGGDADPPAAAIAAAVSDLDRALWRLESALAMTPRSRDVIAELIACLGLKVALLETGEQYASSAAAMLRAASYELMFEVHVATAAEFAMGGLFGWTRHYLDEPATPAFSRLLSLTGEDVWASIDPDVRERAETVLLVAATEIAMREGSVDISLEAIQRAFTLERSGFRFLDGEITVAEVIREAMQGPLEEMTEMLGANVPQPAGYSIDDLDPDDEDIAKMCRWSYDMHSLCAENDPDISDFVGMMLSATVAAITLGDREMTGRARAIHQQLSSFSGVDADLTRLLVSVEQHLAAVK